MVNGERRVMIRYKAERAMVRMRRFLISLLNALNTDWDVSRGS
jgi:hypothetical protein